MHLPTKCYVLLTSLLLFATAPDASCALAAADANLARNGGFEEGMKAWHVGVNVKEKREQIDAAIDEQTCVEGSKALRVTSKSDAIVGEANSAWFALKENQRYVLSFAYRTAKLSRPDATTLRVIFQDAAKRPLVRDYHWRRFKKSDTWTRVEERFVAPAKAVCGYLTFFFFYRTGTIWLDHVRLAEKPFSAKEKARMITEEGITFSFKPRQERPDPRLAALSEKAKARGYVVFVRSNPRDTYPDSIPRADELRTDVRLTATPGEHEPAWFSIHALRELRQLSVRLESDLVSGTGEKIARERVDLRLVKCWPQRTGWKTRTYYVVPELLEGIRPVDVPRQTTQSFYLTVHVPSDAQAGDYLASLAISGADAPRSTVKLTLRVLPFALKRPSNRFWMLYYMFNTPLRTVSEKELEAGLIDIKEHGINALWFTFHHLGSVGPCRFEWKDGRVVGFQWQKLRKIQAVRKAIGLKGPLVISDGVGTFEYDHARRAFPNVRYPKPLPLEDDRFKLAFKDALRAIDRLVKETGGGDYSEWIFEGEDEPGSHPRRQPHALWQLSLAKQVGLKTYATMWGKFSLAAAPSLDVQCYASSYSIGSEESNAARIAECKQHGNRYWYYASGCYTGQEGGLMPNRYLTGFLFFKSRAEGCASWIYQAAKKKPYNDFDANEGREAKDAMIVYPSPQGPVPTLQWEGIREGIDDYCYLWTLSELIRAAESSPSTRRRALAKRAAESFQPILQKVPWRDDYSPEAFGNHTAHELRQAVIAQILDLLGSGAT